MTVTDTLSRDRKERKVSSKSDELQLACVVPEREGKMHENFVSVYLWM